MDWKKFQRVRFWTENCSSCQILKKKFAIKTSRFGSFQSMKTPCIAFLCWFEKHVSKLKLFLRVRFRIEKQTQLDRVQNRKNTSRLFWSLKTTTGQFWSKNFPTCQILHQLLNTLQFFNWHFTTCQILNHLSEHASHFELKNFKRIRFWIEKNFNGLCFGIKIFRHVSFWKKLAIKL